LVCPPQFMTTMREQGQQVLSELALRTGAVVYGYDHPGTGDSRELDELEMHALRSNIGYELIAHRVWQDIATNIPGYKERNVVIAGNSMGAFAAAQLLAVADAHGKADIQLGVLTEAAAIMGSQKTIAEGLSKYMWSTLISKGKFPYEPTSGSLPEGPPARRRIDREAGKAYVDAFRRTTTRQAIRRAMEQQKQLTLITAHGGSSLISPDKDYDDLVPDEYCDRWLDVEYVGKQHNITDNPRVFALIVSSFLDDFRPQPTMLREFPRTDPDKSLFDQAARAFGATEYWAPDSYVMGLEDSPALRHGARFGGMLAQ
jgi:pimeloyl-ACP methyl ester carboxylesterase